MYFCCYMLQCYVSFRGSRVIINLYIPGNLWDGVVWWTYIKDPARPVCCSVVLYSELERDTGERRWRGAWKQKWINEGVSEGYRKVERERHKVHYVQHDYFFFFLSIYYYFIHLMLYRYYICLRLQLKCSSFCCLAYANELIMYIYSWCLLSARER